MTTLVVNKRSGLPFDVYVGRPSKWGNPFSHIPGKGEVYVPSREEAITRYRDWLWGQIGSGEITLDDLRSLHGKRLGCWCAPAPCHAEVLVRAAEWAASQ